MPTSSVSNLTLLLVIACIPCASAGEPGAWHSYRDDTFGYDLDYPAGWTVVEATPQTCDSTPRDGEALIPGVLQSITFREPAGKVWPGEFRVRIREHAEERTVDEWARASFVDVHDDSLVSRAEDTLLAGRAARQFEVFGFDHTGIVAAVVRDGRIYEVGYVGTTPNDPDLAEHASIYERMRRSFRLVPFDNDTSFDLGGACDDALRLPGYRAELREAAARGDHARMIELQKQHVRALCSNQYRWFGLAETYLQAGRADMTTRVLYAIHERGAEIKLSAFRHHPALARHLATPEFEGSALHRELRMLHAAADRRRDVHRARIDALDASAQPPEHHVARAACPFECCAYRDWDVLETTDLYDAPFGTTVVGSVVKKQKVRGVTGDVHLRPAPVAVLHDHPPFVEGEVFFMLDYVGEGFSRYWRDGQIAEAELWVDDVCLRPSEDCWAEYIDPPERRPKPSWWILIETGNGVRGWTDEPERFGNKDACG